MEDSVRQQVRERAAERREYCRIPQIALPWAKFHIEQVRARQHGGTDAFENLALACRRCNLRKGPNLSAVDSEAGAIVRLFHPRTDVWADHFQLQECRIVGLTAVGRATVSLLDMNDSDRVQLRAELVALGVEAA